MYYTKSFLDTPEMIIRKVAAIAKAALFKSGRVDADLVLGRHLEFAVQYLQLNRHRSTNSNYLI